MSKAAVADASPLILLSRAGFLDLLQLLECPVHFPAAVEREIRQKGPDDVTVRAVERAEFLHRVEVPEIPASIDEWDLGAGESEVLAWAREHSGAIALLDDLEARRCAESLDVPVLGTAGMVLAAKRKGRVETARPALEKLIEVGMYLSAKTRDRLLRKVGE